MSNGSPKHGRPEVDITIQKMKPDGPGARAQEQGAEVKQALQDEWMRSLSPGHCDWTHLVMSE